MTPAVSDYNFAFLVSMGLILVTLSFRRIVARGPNPVLAHNVSWAVALAVFSLHWVAYTDVSTLAWLAIVCGIASFNFGAFLPVGLRGNRTGEWSLSPTSMAWATTLLPALFLLGVLFYLRAVATTTGLSSIIHGAASVRTFQGTEGFGVAFPLYARLLYFLGPLVFVLYANPRLSGIEVTRAFRIAVLTLTVLGLAAALGRTLLLIAFIWQAAVVYIRPRQRSSSQRLRRTVGLGVLAVLAIVAFQGLAVYTGKTGADDTRIQPYARGPLRSNAATSLVTYSSGGLPALSALIAEPQHFAYGAATFGPLAKAIPGVYVPKQVGAFVNVPFPHNAFTWLETYYRDFGIPGVIVMPFAVGLATGHMCRARFSSSEALLIGALLLALGLWAPLVNHFPSTFTWEYIVILLLSLRRRRRADAARARSAFASSRPLRPVRSGGQGGIRSTA